MPLPPCPPMEVYSSPSHHFWKPPGVSPLGFSGGSSRRSRTVDWLCLGPAQQRSCIASWGCGPSSTGPDLTIPPCGCHRTSGPTGLAQGSLSQQVLRRVKAVSGARTASRGDRKQWILGRFGKLLQRRRHHQILCFKMAAWDELAFFKQPGIILPKPANFFESQYRKKKNHHATSSKLTSLG